MLNYSTVLIRTVCCLVAGEVGILSAVESYDLDSDNWDKLPVLPTPHCSCAFIMYQGKLYVVGGLSSHGLSGAMEALTYTQTG